MAKKQGSRSQAIRDYLSAHPNEGPTAVSTALSAKGIKVSPTHVSNVAKSMRDGKVTGRRGRPAGSSKSARSAVSDPVGIGLLLSAKEFISKAGGVDKAIGLLKSLGQLFS